MSARVCLVVSALLLALAVAAGAFGAHALRARLGPEMQAVWQTAVQYHFWHALGLLGVGLLWTLRPDAPELAVPAWLLVAGLALFCGSLYVLAISGIRWLGAITPFGGVALIAGWLALAWIAVRR